MSRSSFTAIALALLAGAGTVQAQSPFTLELRGGPAFATEDLGVSSLKTGGGFEMSALWRFMPHTGAYLGWDWHRMVTDEPFLGEDFDVEDTGYAFGLRFGHPWTNSLGSWVRAGGIYNHIELEDDEGDIVSDSGHELGWEAGAGLSVKLGTRFALTPGVRYRTFSTELDVGDTTVPVDLSYVTAEIGFTWTPGGPTFVAARAR